ncbi:MAG: response regulator [Opitutales bacterium]
MSKITKVLVVEDSKIFAQSLREVIEVAPDLEWVGCYGRADACERALSRDHSIAFDLVLLDLHLPDREGLSLIPSIKQRYLNAHIIIITQNDDYLKTLEAVRLGVAGYILKNASIHKIWETIREVRDGGNVIDPRLSKLVLEVLSTPAKGQEGLLSEREVQVLERLSMGFVKKEIAESLDLSINTINGYTENIYKKLQVQNVAAAVATGIRRGLI